MATVACGGDSATHAGAAQTTPVATAPAGDVPVPTVVGQLTGGTPAVPMNAMPADLRQRFHYSETEFAIEGTARTFTPVGPLNADGHWTVKATGGAHYRTRLLVRTPADPKKFNGTVFVEWLNVSSGQDLDPEFVFDHEALLAEGAAYVGVSAQALGVVGQGTAAVSVQGISTKPLIEQNPARYAGLTHPGDDYSYDIFSQAAAAIRFPKGPAPLGTLHPKKLIALGESQSAFRMVSYVNAVAPLAKIFDGYMIHSRPASAAQVLTSAPVAIPADTIVRSDTTVPVMIMQAEGDLFGRLHAILARQDDSRTIVTWEMAGTAHGDLSGVNYQVRSIAEWNPTAAIGVNAGAAVSGLCGGPINDGPEDQIVGAGLAAMTAWVADGTRPPVAPRLRVTDDNSAVARDQFGIALGGIRNPAVDVPIATNSGEPRTASSVVCVLLGSSTPFDKARVALLYPTHADYVSKVTESAGAAVRAGFLLPSDRDAAIAAAEHSAVP
ncbi:alpha/beta hydrolase domain-containing protein [Frankia sp. AgB1.8]